MTVQILLQPDLAARVYAEGIGKVATEYWVPCLLFTKQDAVQRHGDGGDSAVKTMHESAAVGESRRTPTGMEAPLYKGSPTCFTAVRPMRERI